METNETLTISIEAMLPSITEQVAQQIRERALSRIEYAMNEAVASTVKRYIEERIVPEIADEVAKHHEELRAAFVAAVKTSVTMAAEKCVEATAKKLASYEGEKLVGDVLRTLMVGRY